MSNATCPGVTRLSNTAIVLPGLAIFDGRLADAAAFIECLAGELADRFAAPQFAAARFHIFLRGCAVKPGFSAEDRARKEQRRHGKLEASISCTESSPWSPVKGQTVF